VGVNSPHWSPTAGLTRKVRGVPYCGTGCRAPSRPA
jgi:hypothetical protein